MDATAAEPRPQPDAAVEPQAGAKRGTAALLLESMRPRDWAKNAFVLGALLFSGEAFNAGAELRVWAVTLAFCLMSGAAYLFNDVFDREADRHNPRTAGRPIARGDLSPRAALTVAPIAALAALGIALAVNWESAAVLGGFMALQLAYTLLLKTVLFVDVLAVAGGFVLRALAGLTAVDVGISPWLLLCTGLLALFLGFGKRRGEIVAIGGTAHPQRPVLADYSVALVDELIGVVTPTILVAYSLYCVLGARTDAMLLTVPFVMYGIFRMLYLIHHRTSLTEEPAMVIWRDRPLLLCVALWGISAGVVAVASA